MINDQYIINKINILNINNIFLLMKKFSEEEKEYLINRYKDSKSYKETIYRIKNNIEIRPVCETCGGEVEFCKNGYFRKYCCVSCAQKNKNTLIKSQNTKLLKYGHKNYRNLEKLKQTWKNKSKEEKELINKKKQNTCKIRYGVNFIFQSNIYKEKSKKTCLEKYGVENAGASIPSINKAKQTKLEKYGSETYVNPNKAKQTKLEKYGDENYNNKEKIKQTCLEKYGYSVSSKNELVKQKQKETCLEKYGQISYAKTQDFKTKLNWHQIVNKQIQTKKKNGTLNSSKMEDKSYELLKTKYPDVIRQYTSEVYPFNCDFYIPSLDLYIECQYGQFHHHRPYLGTEQDLKDIEILKENAKRIHQEKNVSISRYDTEIDTWSIRDVKKRNIAKENNLNYLEFWNIKELRCWLK